MQASALFPVFTQTLSALREMNVLTDLPVIDAGKGFVCVACGDCDQRPDYMPFLEGRLSQRWHPIFVNGGAASLVPQSKLYYVTDDDGTVIPQGAVYRLQAAASFPLKGINQGVFMVHAPCGAAMGAGMDIKDLIQSVIEAALDFSARHGGLNVTITPAIHVGWSTMAPDSGKSPRTYAVDIEAASRWLAQNA